MQNKLTSAIGRGKVGNALLIESERKSSNWSVLMEIKTKMFQTLLQPTTAKA